MLTYKKPETQEKPGSRFRIEAASGPVLPEGLTVLVFKTSLNNKEETARVKPLLDSLPGISDWSVDHGDCDKVLRITGRDLDASQIIKMIRAKGFNCEVLP